MLLYLTRANRTALVRPLTMNNEPIRTMNEGGAPRQEVRPRAQLLVHAEGEVGGGVRQGPHVGHQAEGAVPGVGLHRRAEHQGAVLDLLPVLRLPGPGRGLRRHARHRHVGRDGHDRGKSGVQDLYCMVW